MRLTIKKRIGAFVLALAMAATALPLDFIGTGVVRAEGEASTDVTNSSELKVNYSDYQLQIVKDDDSKVALTYDDATHTYVWPSDVGVSQVKEITGAIQFAIGENTTEVKAGSYFSFAFPEVLQMGNISSADLVCKFNGKDQTIGTYSVDNNVLTVNLTWDQIGADGVEITGVSAAFSASINKDKLGTEENNRYPFLKAADGAQGYIEIPQVPTELSTITKEGTVQPDNFVVWKITLGSDKDTGVSLAGGTIVEMLDGKQTWEKAYLGDDPSQTLTFTQDAKDANRYTYQFDEDSTLQAPTVITVVTAPTAETMKPDVTATAIDLTNKATYVAKGKAEAEGIGASKTVSMNTATLDKDYTIIDGNTIEWNIVLNHNRANVYKATVKDNLTKGLNVIDSYGIHVKDLTEAGEVTLSSSHVSDTLNGVALSYKLNDNAGAESVAVDYGTFNHEYQITFRTKVSGIEFTGNSEVNNTAYVDVVYPAGKGYGQSVEYGSPEVSMTFMKGHIKIEGTKANEKTGELSWKATPSTNMATDYQGGTMTLKLGAGHEFLPNTLQLFHTDGTAVDASLFTSAFSGDTCTIELKQTLDPNDVYATFDTKASKDTYFADDVEHIYSATADLEIRNKQDKFNANQAEAQQSLKNNMVNKAASSYYSDSKNETVFSFTINVNKNELTLNHAKLTDDLSGVLFVTDVSNLDATNNLKAGTTGKALSSEDYEIRSVTSKKGTVNSDYQATKKVEVTYDTLTEADTVTIEVALSDAGKAKLKLNSDYSEKVFYAENTATVTADELADAGISHSVHGLKYGQIAINKVMDKTGEQVKAEGKYTSTISWRLDINHMGAYLGSNPYIVDTIPDGLTLDKSTIHLYAAKHGTNGTLITGADTAKEITEGFSFTSVKNKNGTTTLTVNLPKSDAYKNAAFVLMYDTAIAGDGKSYSNEAEIHVDKATAMAISKMDINAISHGVGKLRAYLTMTKTDELSTQVPVEGAKYGIFATEADATAGKEETTIDVGYTNKQGKITFTVPGDLDSKLTYYVRELSAPDALDNDGGYQLDETVYPISNVSFGRKNIGPNGIWKNGDTKTFDDKRIKDTAKTGTVDLTNTFIQDSEGGKHSNFTLYVYPTGTEKKAVKVAKTAEGPYKFVDYSEGTSFAGSDSVINGDNSVSDLKITNLPWGTYHLVETKTADGFILAKEIVFTVDSEGKVTGAKNIDNEKTVLTITDNAAADYTITGKFADGTTEKELSGTDLTKTGGVVYEGLAIQGQNYTLVQTKTPDGYKKHANDSVKIVNGNEKKALTETPIAAKVIIRDQDGKKVQNAKIHIAPQDGSKLNKTVDAANTLTLDQCVNIGSKYDLTVALDDEAYLPVDGASATLEVSADGSTVATTATKPAVLGSKAADTTVTLTVQKIYANVEIREYSEDDTDRANLLTGGTFELYKKDGTKVGSIITDQNESGKTDITKLPAGAYDVKQVTAPNAYTVIDTETKYPVEITAAENGTTIYVDVFNHPVPGSITVTKKSDTGTKTLEGATYQLYTKDAEGKHTVVATATTDVDGKMKFEQLLWDTYYLREVSAPAGYQIDKQEYGPWIIDASHQDLVKEVSEEPTVVTIHTTGIDIRDGKDETDADVTKEDIGEGALSTKMTYEVTGIFAGDTEESTKEFADDDKDGLIKVSNEFVLGNTYTFTQKSVKRPYNKVEGFAAEITEDNAKADGDKIEIVNHMNRLAMQLVNGEGERLAGGTFELYQLDDAGQWILSSKRQLKSKMGKLDITGLVPGTYELVETVAPVEDGQFTYALDNSGLKFTLNEDNTVKILSTNADATRQNEEAAAKNETKADAVLGKANSLLKMDEAVLTYVNVPTRLYFDVDVFYNEDCNKDKDATADLAGVYYTVCTPEDEDNGFCIMRPISDEEDGKVVVEGLPLGTYEVKMSDSKGNNVILNDEVYTAEVVGVPFAGLKYTNGATVEQEVKDVNGEMTGVSVLKYNVYKEDLILAKTDAEDDSKLLAGSTYRLYRKDSFQSKDAINYDKDKVEDEGTKFNEFVAEATTDSDGKLTFEGVTVGVEYLVQEVGEPSGYQVSKDPIKVRFIRDNKLGTTSLQNINDGDGTAEVSEDGTVTWKEPRLKVAIRLVDEEGNPLSGGQLELKDDAAGSTKRSWTTSNQNELFSGELTGGQNYTVVQTAAPSGYQPSENVTFVAERKALSAKDDYVQVITVVNTKVAGAVVKKDVTTSATATSATSDNHKVKVSSAWVHKSPKTNDSWFGDLVEWILTK
ncbi:MAG: hypothetical protein IJK17_09880 [Lachnospiraceae bacterium]|nr:hypothetical protein [Lachnospiraceae bacterium]